MRLMRYAALIVTLILFGTASVQARGHPPHAAVAISVIAVAELPPEARQTLRLIQQGGAFPFPRDGIVFGNYERILPPQVRGYYHEYTVKTPGVRSRGARRLVCGAPVECYYSDDHYQSFRHVMP
jgi:ribonuclease T1